MFSAIINMNHQYFIYGRKWNNEYTVKDWT